VVNRRAYQSDLIIATGVVEPHQYAGYSGGGKTLAIGCGGEATIGFTHGATMLETDGVRLGQIAGVGVAGVEIVGQLQGDDRHPFAGGAEHRLLQDVIFRKGQALDPLPARHIEEVQLGLAAGPPNGIRRRHGPRL